MKENAILIAAIAFFTGCAHQHSGYSEADYDRSAAYSSLDAAQSKVTTEQVYRDAEGRIATPADPSTTLQRDPAYQAQGTAAGAATGSETSIQADSSERGTSLRARGIELSENPTESEVNSPAHQDDNEIQADSSQRGGSLQARQGQDPGGTRELKMSQPDYDTAAELNASDELENNISGEFDLDDRMEAEASGSAAGSEIRSGQSDNWDQADLPESDVIPSDGERLFNSNPAQGVGGLSAPNTAAGTAATTEIGREQMSGESLAQRVKQRLTQESTGTHGLMRHQVVRNVKVTAEGGNVTLKGSVPTQQDKDILTIRAREIPGVESVDNQVTVSPDSDPAARDLSEGHDLEEIQD